MCCLSKIIYRSNNLRKRRKINSRGHDNNQVVTSQTGEYTTDLVFLTQNEMAGDDCQNTSNSPTRQEENRLVTMQ